MSAFTLMVQGTTSDAGKSTLVCGLCRALKRRGIAVAPFKPQNMSLNSAVTPQGHEIGRAQALQAQAARLEPTSDMNPVLLKPNTDTGAQVIVHGRAIGNMEARTYHEYKGVAREAVLSSYSRLENSYEAVIVEGAGSPAEINLREGDIANMGFAEAVDCPVILIADIERGGVFAHIVGTLELLAASERQRVIGFVINRFRGDLALLEPGLRWLEERTGKPVLGVLPYLHGLALDAEDGLTKADARDAAAALRVLVPVLPHISNHTDFDPLRVHPQVSLHFARIDEHPPQADLVILPGSKNVRADLDSLRKHGWDEYLTRHLRYGGRLIGICGGLQMLGSVIHDSSGIESAPGSSRGLALLDLETELQPEKQLRNVGGRLTICDATVSGYEIHCGTSSGPAFERPFAYVDGRAEGARSADDRILGTYLHGIFEAPSACAALLGWAGLEAPSQIDYGALREASIERLADTVEQSIDLAALIERLRGAA